MSATPGFFAPRTVLVGAQMLFVAFGALVLMPLLTGLDPSVALFTAGVGTLLFQCITGFSIPVFLASSFVFIAPISHGVQAWGLPATMGALMVTAVVYVVLAALVRWRGPGFLHVLMPPVVTGPIIMVIGLSLAPTAVNMAMGMDGSGQKTLFPYGQALTVSMVSLVTTLLVATLAKGFFRLLPIMVGVLCGYLSALMLGMVDFAVVTERAWLAPPEFVLPTFEWQAIVFMVPVALAPAIEHVGDVLAISNVTGRDYVRKPGLHRTLLGDGVASMGAAMVGGPPNTTYSEVTGAVMLTRVFDPRVMVWAAVFAIALSFLSRFGGLLQSIPAPVMGGILILMFGSIASVGMNTLIKAKVDLARQRNLVIVATTLVFGIGGMVISGGGFTLQGISLCGVLAVVLNLLLPGRDPVVTDLRQEQAVVDDLIEHTRSKD
ncbi:uracil permease [Alloalcanivorax xenomutans]|uniref:uracil-xanthine permease family protein n=1 Tax=Alloalcanivorax xenomutans TaxID=1094342 RepID=UPI000BC80D57|nr:uracil-xanthine permease family protein [Alloalcanivorax xenomutans]MBA4723152.1 uracil-xanthine permease [Alcanivorax sp.]SOC12313.1 uracil permease [Alloalcanivorax xenomutans]